MKFTLFQFYVQAETSASFLIKIRGFERQLRLLRARDYGNQPIKTTKIPYVHLKSMIEAEIPEGCTSITFPTNEKTEEELTIYNYEFDNGR